MQIQLRCVLVVGVGHVGLKEGLHVTEGRVDVVMKLWLRLEGRVDAVTPGLSKA
jgi:hypothetical protein